MTSMRKRKNAVDAAMRAVIRRAADEDRWWDEMRPVGREFGSPDFDRLMEEDFRNGVGVFDRNGWATAEQKRG